MAKIADYKEFMTGKLGARELRILEPTRKQLKLIKKHPLVLVLDNVLDTYNIGSIFRLADAIAAEKIYLCGQTTMPPDSRIHKAAVGTEKWVKWQYFKDTRLAINDLKRRNYSIVALEQGTNGKDYRLFEYPSPLAVVVGNEQYGIDSSILKLSDAVVEIPLYGINRSLNVVVSLAVLLFKIADNF